MFNTRSTLVAITILSCFLHAQGASKYYTDENRPYEFGFTIDGEQHRHEKKDENGLIMGEFGFITADGVYHVTVYATDENGNFKILSMKNIRVKPYPTAPARKGNSLPFPPSSSQAGPIAQAPAQQTLQANTVAQEPVAPVKTCSHCSIPTTTTTAPSLMNIAQVSRDQQYNPQYPDNQQYTQNSQQPQFPGNQYPQDQENPQNSEYPSNQQYPENQQYPQNSQYPENQQYSEYDKYSPDSQSPQNPQYPENPRHQENLPGDYNQETGQHLQSGERNPKQFNLPQYPQETSVPSKPTLISAQMQIVDKNTDIYRLGPGEREGLPNGLNKQDMKLLLYTFNYTVGFHGHQEEGYTDGTKVGYYFVTGRNGVRTRVDYVADENGFRPKISQEVLDLLSDDVPKEETEKDPKFGLKGYEFKWIYYPVESKR